MKNLIANGVIDSLLKENFKFFETKIVNEVKYTAEIKYNDFNYNFYTLSIWTDIIDIIHENIGKDIFSPAGF